MALEDNREENRELGIWAFVVFGTITVICVAIIGFAAPTHTEYQYDVKAEQVYDNDKIDDAVALQDLSEDEQNILYNAFKKTDHFMGGSEVTINTNEKLGTFNGWKVIEIQGVYLLVAISGPEEVTYMNGTWPYIVVLISTISSALALVGLKEMLFPSYY